MPITSAYNDHIGFVGWNNISSQGNAKTSTMPITSAYNDHIGFVGWNNISSQGNANTSTMPITSAYNDHIGFVGWNKHQYIVKATLIRQPYTVKDKI